MSLINLQRTNILLCFVPTKVNKKKFYKTVLKVLRNLEMSFFRPKSLSPFFAKNVTFSPLKNSKSVFTKFLTIILRSNLQSVYLEWKKWVYITMISILISHYPGYNDRKTFVRSFVSKQPRVCICQTSYEFLMIIISVEGSYDKNLKNSVGKLFFMNVHLPEKWSKDCRKNFCEYWHRILLIPNLFGLSLGFVPQFQACHNIQQNDIQHDDTH